MMDKLDFVAPYTLSQRDALDDKVSLYLDWNEATQDLFAERIQRLTLKLNYYPNLYNIKLLKSLSEYTQIPMENILYYNGSDHALEQIASAFISPGDEIVSIVPNYDHFRVYCQVNGGTYLELLYDDLHSGGVSNLNKLAIPPKIVYLSNPNNPTGQYTEIDTLLPFITEWHDTIFIIDEAYYEFCEKSFATLVLEHENVVVTRSFSKAFGLAGLRFGYILAGKILTDQLLKIHNPKAVPTFTQLVAEAVLDDVGPMLNYVNVVNQQKEIITKFLKSTGSSFIIGCANYFLLKCDPVEQLNKFNKKNIMVRDRSKLPLLHGYIRITIGDAECTKKIIEVLDE